MEVWSHQDEQLPDWAWGSVGDVLRLSTAQLPAYDLLEPWGPRTMQGNRQILDPRTRQRIQTRVHTMFSG
jgi:hypothetical protein